MGPNPNGPLSVSCETELLDTRFFFGVRDPWVLLEIFWILTWLHYTYMYIWKEEFLSRHVSLSELSATPGGFGSSWWNCTHHRQRLSTHPFGEMTIKTDQKRVGTTMARDRFQSTCERPVCVAFFSHGKCQKAACAKKNGRGEDAMIWCGMVINLIVVGVSIYPLYGFPI